MFLTQKEQFYIAFIHRTDITHGMCLEMQKQEKKLIDALENFYEPGLKKQVAYMNNFNKFYDDLASNTAKQHEEYDDEGKF